MGYNLNEKLFGAPHLGTHKSLFEAFVQKTGALVFVKRARDNTLRVSINGHRQVNMRDAVLHIERALSR